MIKNVLHTQSPPLLKKGIFNEEKVFLTFSIISTNVQNVVKGKSTATAGLLNQSMIARALDDNELVLLASLDLSAAFHNKPSNA